MKDRLTEKDTYYHGELEKAQTNADRDIFDLRRKLDKIDLSYQDQLEKLTEKYEKEIGEKHQESIGFGSIIFWSAVAQKLIKLYYILPLAVSSYMIYQECAVVMKSEINYHHKAWYVTLS